MTMSVGGLVPLPAEKNHLEAYHEVAWLYLLDPDKAEGQSSWIANALETLGEHLSQETQDQLLNPDHIANWTMFAQVVSAATAGSMWRSDYWEALLSGLRIHFPAEVLLRGAQMSLEGGCGSDLFLKCKKCDGDRVVIELKGPGQGTGTVFNYSKPKGAYQVSVYERAYGNGAGACTCWNQFVEAPEGGLLIAPQMPLFMVLDACGRTRQDLESSHPGLDLKHWEVVGYTDILTDSEIEPAARWLYESVPRSYR